MENSGPASGGQASPQRPQFAPLPMSVLADQRCREIHLRAAGAIGYRDRLNANGQGCWSRPEDLAQLAGVNMTNLVTAISELVQWGHVDRQQHPADKRRRIYRLIYRDFVCPEANDIAEIVCPEGKDRLPGAKLSDCDDTPKVPLREPYKDNHFLKHSAEADQDEKFNIQGVERNCAEAHALEGVAEALAGQMRIKPELRMSEARWRHKRDEIVRAGEKPNGHSTWDYDPERAKRFGARLT